MALLTSEQQVIREIRTKNGVEDDLLRRAREDPALGATIHHLKDGYARALVILSDELYAKPAHCILEMIQNAVDNSYAAGVSPTLVMELRRSDLQIWCNEVGFNEANVKAFCSIGNSTKKNKKGYIGEKGIGAKSMFKVATKVTVQSRGYSFVLDREKELGMISPIWEPRAVPIGREEWTGINLYFGPNKPFDDLKAQLLEIKDTILLFLDKLSVFKVNIDGSIFAVQRGQTGNCMTLRTSSGNTSTTKSFVRVAKTIKMQVSDPKREGQVDTEVIFAFPLKDDGQPDVHTLPNVHAFLPLRRVGFKFVVHADFLTAANREDVLTDNHWNTAIRDSLASVFVGAVEHLRAKPLLEFTWPRFIPRANDISDSFFKLTATNTLVLLKQAAIIGCSDGIDRSPSQVRFVGSFKDAHGRPFVEPVHLNFHYIASEYPTDVVAVLKSQLGVAEMSLSDFVTGLISMNNRGVFKHQDTVWLEGVCDTLTKHGFSWNSPLDSRIRLLPLIQLSTGGWVSCQSCDKYFFDSSRLTFPSGLTIQAISGPTSQSINRCSVLRKLGVCDLDISEVIRQIIALHRVSTPTFEVTLEHIIYLYNHRTQLNTSVTHIHLYDQHRLSQAGKDLYMDDPHDSGPDLLRALFSGQARFVHDNFQRPASLFSQYTQGTYAVASWQDWLVTTFGVLTAPRVVGGQPAAEFVTTIDCYRLEDSPRLFRLLKKYWSKISSRVSGGERKVLQAYFSALEVRCQDGQVVPLRATFFPNHLILQYGCDGLPLLNLSDSTGDWSFLGTLGVSMQPDGGFFLKQLVILSQTPGDKVRSSDVVALYEHINARFVEISSEVRTAFSEHALILSDKQWYNMQGVVWKGPAYLTLMPALSSQYSHLKTFFQDRLRIKDAPPDIIAKELQHFSSRFDEIKSKSPEFDHLLRLFRHASRSVTSIRSGELADWTPKVHGCSLFPVKSLSDNPDATFKLMAISDLFFVHGIGSRHLYTLFRDVVPFLALDSQQLFESTSFLEHVGVLPGKWVDKHVSRTVEIDGQPITATSSWKELLNDDDTQYFNAKRSYLQRYLYYQCNKRRLQFTAFRVYNVSSIKVSCTLSNPEHTKDTQCATWVSIDDNIANIFLANEAAATALGKLSVGKIIANTLNIDVKFMTAMILSPDDSITMESVMELFEIGPLVLAAEDDDDYTPTQMPVLPPIVPLSPTSATTGGAAVAEGRPSRASKSFFSQASRDENPIRSSVAPMDPSQSLLLYVTSERGRADMEKSAVRARNGGIPPATRFKDAVAASSELVQNLTLLSHPGGTALDLVPVNSMAPASAPAHSAPRAYIEAGEAQGDVNSLAEQLQELSVRSSIAPRQSYSFTEIEQVPTRALEIGFLGEQYVYELLKSTLPDFTGANWTSELRKFADLSPFAGISYADFQYQDYSGELTRQLLPHEPEVHGATPEVFIEVKSTSGSQDNIFHMSSQQFRRAAEMWRGRNSNSIPTKLYVLFRLSNVGNSGEPVLRTYVDAHDLLARGLMRIVSSSVEVQICGEEV